MPMQLHSFVFSVLHVGEHNHPVNESEVQRGLLLKRIHENIQKNSTIPVRRLYDNVMEDVDEEDFAYQPTFGSIETRAKRFRGQFMPAIPRTIADVDIVDNWRKTWNDRNFLSHLDNNWGIAVFATSRMLKCLHKAKTVYIDGTFRTAPRPYKQFVTIHGLYHGFVIPLVFCLLNGKTTGHYRQLFQHIKREIRRLTGHRFQPRQVVMDFEQSIVTAVETELPRSRISGCYFHFTQSLWRHVQASGLASDYRTNEKLKKLMRKIMAIGFLPVLVVRNNFTNLRTHRRTNRLVGRFPALDEWLDYVETTYISRNAVFGTTVWNVYDRNVDTRTNNHLEGKLSNELNKTFTIYFTTLIRQQLTDFTLCHG
jgi:hypothetical protein